MSSSSTPAAVPELVAAARAAPVVMEDEDGAGGRGCGGDASGAGDGYTELPRRRVRVMCEKCHENVATARTRKMYHCAHCLCEGVAGKVKWGLTATPAYGRPLMVAFSGGAASRAVLRGVRRILDCGRRKRAYPAAAAVLVDTSVIGDLLRADAAVARFVPAADAWDEQLYAAVREVLSEGLSLVLMPLEQAFSDTLLARVVAAPAVPVASTGAGATAVCTPLAFAEGGGDAAARAAAAVRDVAAARAADAEWAASRVRLASAFSAYPTADGRQAYLSALITQCCVSAAVWSGYHYVAQAECADTTAVKLMHGATTGRGLTLPLDCAPIDPRWQRPADLPRAPCAVHASALRSDTDGALDAPCSGGSDAAAADARVAASSAGACLSVPFLWYKTMNQAPQQAEPAAHGVTIIRPCLEVEAKELTLYARWSGLTCVSLPNFMTGVAPNTSMLSTTEALLASLQPNFVNTVHNVVRTVRKLQLPPGVTSGACSAAAAATSPPRWCIVCAALLPTDGTPFAHETAEAAQRVGLVPARAPLAASLPRALQHMCYGCALDMQRPGLAAAPGAAASPLSLLDALARPHSTGMSTAAAAVEAMLPRAEVSDFSLQRWAAGATHATAPLTHAVRVSREDMRRQLAAWLLDEEEAAVSA